MLLLCISLYDCIPINCSIIVHYSDPRHVSRYLNPITGNPKNIIHHKICALRQLSIRVFKGLLTLLGKLGYMEPISPNWVEEVETMVLRHHHFS
jgi:hypothetical protein